jgi:hypothetical protein
MKIKVLTVLDQQCPRFAISLSSRPKTLTKKKKKKKKIRPNGKKKGRRDDVSKSDSMPKRKIRQMKEPTFALS